MTIQIGIIGLPDSGKTTIFNALTGKHEKTGAYSVAAEEHEATITIPDERLTRLIEIYTPKKSVYAHLDFIDIGGDLAQHAKPDGKEDISLTHLRHVDALAHIVRIFDNETVPHPDGSIDPVRDIQKVNSELVLADMLSIEKRLGKLQLSTKKLGKLQSPTEEKEKNLLEKLNRCRQCIPP